MYNHYETGLRWFGWEKDPMVTHEEQKGIDCNDVLKKITHFPGILAVNTTKFISKYIYMAWMSSVPMHLSTII